MVKPFGWKQSISLSKRWSFVTIGPNGGMSSSDFFFFFFFFSKKKRVFLFISIWRKRNELFFFFFSSAVGSGGKPCCSRRIAEKQKVKNVFVSSDRSTFLSFEFQFDSKFILFIDQRSFTIQKQQFDQIVSALTTKLISVEENFAKKNEKIRWIFLLFRSFDLIAVWTSKRPSGSAHWLVKSQ